MYAQQRVKAPDHIVQKMLKLLAKAIHSLMCRVYIIAGQIMFTLFHGRHNDKENAEQRLRRLVEAYYEPLYFHVRRMVVSHDDARDVMQEVWIRVYQGIGHLRDSDAEKSWVWRIASNEALRFLRRRASLAESSDAAELADVLADAPDADVDRTDVLAYRLELALLSLTDRQREVFNLRYHEGLPYEEIAAITGGKPSTVKAVFHQAKEKLRKKLGNEHDNDQNAHQ